MARTFKGKSVLKTRSRSRHNASVNNTDRLPVLEIEAIKGEVHRFEGTVVRLGSALKGTGVIQTVCVKDFIHCRTGQALDLDHWWFRLRCVWMRASVRPGDRVIFEAKVQRCTKGVGHAIDSEQKHGKRLRHQMIGFGIKVKSVAVKQRLSSFMMPDSSSCLTCVDD
jgi:hypothetical protein